MLSKCTSLVLLNSIRHWFLMFVFHLEMGYTKMKRSSYIMSIYRHCISTHYFLSFLESIMQILMQGLKTVWMKTLCLQNQEEKNKNKKLFFYRINPAFIFTLVLVYMSRFQCICPGKGLTNLCAMLSIHINVMTNKWNYIWNFFIH